MIPNIALLQRSLPLSEAAGILRALKCKAIPVFGLRSPLRVRRHVRALLTMEHAIGDDEIRNWRECFPNAGLISAAFTGTDRVDAGACRSRGFEVAYAPGYSTASVAELVVLLTLGVLRNLRRADRSLRVGHFDGDGVVPGAELAAKTVLLLGSGTIARAAARAFLGFGCNVLLWSTRRDRVYRVGRDDKLRGCDYDLPKAIALAHVVSIHMRATPETKCFIDRDKLSHMRPDAILVNTARAELVDTRALVAALRRGGIAGAGIDVFETEPMTDRQSPLLQLENVLLTPHIGWKTREASHRKYEVAFRNIANWLSGRSSNILMP